MSPVKALRLALARTADALWDLALVTQGIQHEQLDQEAAHEAVPNGQLLVLLDGIAGATGLIMVDREVMTAMTEVQTILQVTAMPIEDREITQTDAAMMAPLIDGALSRFESNLKGHPDLVQLSGFRFGAMVEDARTAGLLLDAARYRIFRVALDLGGGKRLGDLQILLPEREIATDPEPEIEQGPGPHEQRLSLVPAQIDVVLCRVRMSLHKATNLKPGDLLELPADALTDAELMVGQKHRMARGKLGQINGFRAIRLEWPFSQAARDVAVSGGASDPGDTPDHGAAGGVQMSKDMADAGPPPMALDLDNDEDALPDLPPMDFDAVDFDSDATDFDFDPDALASEAGDMPMAAMAEDWDDT